MKKIEKIIKMVKCCDVYKNHAQAIKDRLKNLQTFFEKVKYAEANIRLKCTIGATEENREMRNKKRKCIYAKAFRRVAGEAQKRMRKEEEEENEDECLEENKGVSKKEEVQLQSLMRDSELLSFLASRSYPFLSSF